MSDICKQDTDKVLLVEGIDDCHVVMALCAAHQVPETFGLYECNGDTKVLKRLNALIVRPNHPQVIGVMLDADSPSLEGRWESIKGKLTDILHHSQQGEINRVCERKRKGFSFTDSQQTRFLAVVQDVS